MTRITSGITPLDAQLGGFVEGRIHVFVGMPGTGKTSATIHFLDAALRTGESAALLTRERGTDLISHAAHLGLDVRPALRSGQLAAVRYRSDFASRLGSGVPVGRVLDELRVAWSAAIRTRVAINSCSPFLADGAPSDARILALTEFLEGSGATSVVTLPGELSAATIDRRLEPLLDRAAAVLRFSREADGHYRVDVVKVRQSYSSSHPIRFTIRAPNGITAAGAESEAAVAAPARRLALLPLGGVANELLAEFAADYQPGPRVSLAEAAEPGRLAGAGALIIDVGTDQVEQLPARLRQLLRATRLPPVIVLAAFDLPSPDRGHILAAGADEIITADMSAEERRARLAAAIHRGRGFHPSPPGDTRTGAVRAP